MNMKEIDKQVSEELFKERTEFVKNFLKNKRAEIERLDKQFEEVVTKLEKAEEEYESFLILTVDEVYDKYRPKSFIMREYPDISHRIINIPGITGSFSHKLRED